MFPADPAGPADATRGAPKPAVATESRPTLRRISRRLRFSRILFRERITRHLRKYLILTLRGASATHDRPHVDDLIASGDVVTVKSVGALIQVGAIDLETVAHAGLFVAVLPP